MWHTEYKQFFFVKTLYYWAIYIFNTYYITFIFRQTNDPNQVVLNIVYTYIATFLGLVAGSILMGKIGVERTLKLSFFLSALTGIVGIFLTGTPYDSYILVSILRGISGGFFWAAMNYIEVGMEPEARSKYYSMLFGSSTLFSVVAPIMLGGVLAYYASYIPVYLIFSLLCTVGMMFPYSFNLKGDLQLTIRQFSKIFMENHFTEFLYIKMIASLLWIASWVVSSLLPFIVLGNEFNMGVFLGISSAIGAGISVLVRNMKSAKKTKWGMSLLVVLTISSIPLMIDISLVTLTLAWVMSAITSAIITPVENELQSRASKHMTTSKTAYSEIIVAQEAVYLVTRLAFGLAVLFLLQLFPLDIVLKTIFVLSIVVKVTHYLLASHFAHEKVF